MHVAYTYTHAHLHNTTHTHTHMHTYTTHHITTHTHTFTQNYTCERPNKQRITIQTLFVAGPGSMYKAPMFARSCEPSHQLPAAMKRDCHLQDLGPSAKQHRVPDAKHKKRQGQATYCTHVHTHPAPASCSIDMEMFHVVI